MSERLPPEIEMRPDGTFVDPPRPLWSARIFRIAALLAIFAALVAAAIFLIGFALILIPVAFGSALVAWAALRYRIWKAARSMGDRRDIFPG
ncbi:MAG: hypothetical protein EXR05_07885 [Acetobacteraceae bacterium]|nr:hypothetical protein [Acetobacteraceae bacterium]MSP29681.1 hypothetical protein [Acetobacteraceae bacterium]